MFTAMGNILRFMLEALGSTWPYFLITIPLAVAVNVSGAAKYIQRAFQARPLVSILLATLVGAFSPFCSCSVIPLVASLLIGGVPLGPVMSFWIASPSMDPEIFFLSAALLGWELALWRMGATLALSLGAGLITHILVSHGWLGDSILRTQHPPKTLNWSDLLENFREQPLLLAQRAGNLLRLNIRPVDKVSACCPAGSAPNFTPPAATAPGSLPSTLRLVFSPESQLELRPAAGSCESNMCSLTGSASGTSRGANPDANLGFKLRLLNETLGATRMVLGFMLLAYFLEALIHFYVPSAWITAVLGRQNPLSLVTAALLGVPVYTSNLTALPLVGGLLDQGLSPAAALAFLITGPTTTLPAMSAVFGLVRERVFILYITFALAGAVLLGSLYQLFS